MDTDFAFTTVIWFLTKIARGGGGINSMAWFQFNLYLLLFYNVFHSFGNETVI